MKTILIKTDHISGHHTLANPLARPGQQNERVTVTAIRNVPDDLELPKLLQLWNTTCNLTWLRAADPMAGGRFEFDFAELGVGKMIL